MPILTAHQYTINRQQYSYSDTKVTFDITQTGSLPYCGNFHGIFPGIVPATHPDGINLRKFERICQSVFQDASAADGAGAWTPNHVRNIQSVSLAIVHWKMASQGGRASLSVGRVSAKWNGGTHIQLLRAYQNRSLCQFKIGGVRIPTASAFLRFLYPDEFGIVDRRVVKKHTQLLGITTMNLRRCDGYINDVQENVVKYTTQYIPFLVCEAAFLNAVAATFLDVDQFGNLSPCSFRPCDIEMALF